MSIGHQHAQPSRLAHGRAIETLMRQGGAPALLKKLQHFDIDHDIPYGVGVSVDGTTRYADSDLVRALYDPAYAEHIVGEHIDTGLSPDDALQAALQNVTVEKTLVDSDNPVMDYNTAHDYGAAAEQDFVKSKGSTPLRFRRGLAKLLQYCARKPLKRVPHDLDCAAVLADHTSNGRRIHAELNRLGVEDADRTPKDEVAYGYAHQGESCGKCSMWLGEANAALAHCSLVQGLVRDTRTCDRYEPAGSRGRGDPVGNAAPAGRTPNSGDTAKSPQNGGTQHILLARHGATSMNNEDNSVDRIRSWKDIPLSAQGKAEAERLGKKIAADPPDIIVTSDLKRAYDTAEIIAKACGMQITASLKGLRPWRFGYLTGMTSKDAIPIMAEFIRKKPDTPVPAGKGEPEGESFHSFLDRYFDTVYQILKRYPGKVVLMVAHHRNERAMHGWEAAGFPPDGRVDVGVFSKKGEAPGTVCPMDIPLKAIDAFESKHGAGQ
jgi:probable phosphoglycerate mutase